MARVFLHTRNSGERDWNNEFREFARIPILGEYVSIESSDKNWFRVELVVHTPFPCDCDAEVYAVATNHSKVLEDVLVG